MATEEAPQDASTAEASSRKRRDDAVIQAFGLKRYYPVTGGPLRRRIGDVKAVDGVDLTIRRGQTHGLVGESGCGKSTLARLLVKLDEPTAGHIYFDAPEDVADEIAELERTDAEARTREETRRLAELRREYEINTMTRSSSKAFRRRAQFVFQNPTSSLNPRKTILNTVGQMLRLREDVSRADYEDEVTQLLEQVGLGEDFLHRHPHMLSGGQKQRVAIARAIAPDPELIVLDEPTSALDVSVQAQILNLLEDLQDDLGLTYLFITHDLGVIHHVADDVSVMYLGKRVEVAPCEPLFDDPKHPYTEALLSASPALPEQEHIELIGDVPDAQNPPTGCPFHTRCHRAESFCGFSGRDVEALFHDYAERDETVNRLLASLVETEYDGYTAIFRFDDHDSAHEMVDALRDEAGPFSTINEPLFHAVEDADRDGRSVHVEFVEVATPELGEIGSDHEVACHLYETSTAPGG